MGRVRDPRAGAGRRRRDFSGIQLCPGGQGPRRPRGHGRDLSQGRGDPTGRGTGQILGISPGDRQRLIGRARRSDHPDRFGARFNVGTDHSHARGSANCAGRRGRGRRDRRHLQYADRRRDVRHRTDDAGGERRDLPSGRHRNRNGHLRGPVVLRRCAGFPCAAASDHGGRLERPDRADPICRARCAERSGRSGFHPGPASGRGPVRQDQVALFPSHAGHAHGGRADVRAIAHLRPVLRRRSRLRDGAGRAVGTDLDLLAARAAGSLQSAGNIA